jgi:hypothetical protein
LARWVWTHSPLNATCQVQTAMTLMNGGDWHDYDHLW